MHAHFVTLTLSLLVLAGCGSRTNAFRRFDGGSAAQPSAELCNGIDDDGIGGVDDPFRDGQGRYLNDAHCGACNSVCAPRGATELEVQCELVDEVPRCVAQRCTEGNAPARDGRCEPIDERLCLPCANDRDCGSLMGARCALIAGESRCSVACSVGCPGGYQCDPESAVCVPLGRSCSCGAGQTFDLACAAGGDVPREAGAPVCVGRARCVNGVVSACETKPEVCDHDDNDCDGLVDEGYLDSRMKYSVNAEHCGECGVSCLEDTSLELELACGGDPFAPRCTVACPDASNGTQVGDMLDGDLDIGTGCECQVTALRDEPGPGAGPNAAIDVNCDGADGHVLASIYVAPDGDDSWAGSPTRPLRTLGAAMQQASLSLSGPEPRTDVFVAAGTYAETLTLVDGVSLHGGYRRDFRALDPAAFVSEVRAPADTAAPGGAALLGRGIGSVPTVVEGLSLRGRDATTPASGTLGAYLEQPGAALTLRQVSIRAGIPGEGASGADGAAGSAPSAPPGVGEAPRAAREQGVTRECNAGGVNRVRGGAGGQNVCGGSAVGGGAGGAAGCPEGETFSFQGSGGRGLAQSGSGGAGGTGGQDARGPITGDACDGDVCCGLADFTVPTNFTGPSAGQNGRVGGPGAPGNGCRDGFGGFQAGAWVGGRGFAGQPGQPGAGGGGGGAGGGAEIDYMDGVCEFADGLGGGGGGGGAGGCGGAGGGEGTSGAPSVALLVSDPAPFQLLSVALEPADGARGGPGGAGGDGGPGGAGAFGGAVLPEARTTPTLAGTYPGARGGSGGAGGAGGGGGGGCGGASVGVWIVGTPPANLAAWRAGNSFVLGVGGAGGEGGGGAQVGSSGTPGEAIDVFVQR